MIYLKAAVITCAAITAFLAISAIMFVAWPLAVIVGIFYSAVYYQKIYAQMDKDKKDL